MKDAKRATRRGQAQRMKRRALATMRRWAGRRPFTVDPRDLGRNVSTHCRPCACWMCQENRKEVPSPRESAFDDPEFDR